MRAHAGQSLGADRDHIQNQSQAPTAHPAENLHYPSLAAATAVVVVKAGDLQKFLEEGGIEGNRLSESRRIIDAEVHLESLGSTKETSRLLILSEEIVSGSHCILSLVKRSGQQSRWRT